MTENLARKRKFALIILAYPFALIVPGLLANTLFFSVAPATVALPEHDIIVSLVISAVLLLANHTWLMTSTELTRLRFDLHATPEEWEQSGHSMASALPKGVQELERHHNAHRNATENTVHFAFLALLVCVVSPTPMAVLVWTIGFAIGRLGHTFSYLTGRDGLRGLFMSVSLISLYGLASYLIVSLFV